MILAVISSLIGLSSAKMAQAAMNGSTSHSSTLQASAIAATDLDLLRSIEYKDLASSAKAAVPDSPYFHEIIVSNESSYSDTIKQKTVSVKVYKGSEAIPRAEVKLTRYSAESKPSGNKMVSFFTHNAIPSDMGTCRISSSYFASEKMSYITSLAVGTDAQEAHENRPPYYALFFIMKLE